MGEVHKLREKAGETEKITVNLGHVDLGHIDLLVQEGFYSNRTDFIRTAIRNQLANHSDAIKQSILRNTLELGLRSFTREELEAVRAAGHRLRIGFWGSPSSPRTLPPSSRGRQLNRLRFMERYRPAPR